MCVKKTLTFVACQIEACALGSHHLSHVPQEVLREVVGFAWPGDQLRFSVKVSETFSLISTFNRAFFSTLSVEEQINSMETSTV